MIEEAATSPHINRMENVRAAIENYISTAGLILSNPYTLANKQHVSDDVYVVYGDNIAYHANELANHIAKINIYTMLTTVERDRDMYITVDGGMVAQFYGVRNNLRNAILPIKRADTQIQLYPPEFELITIYHKLYDPTYNSKWESLLELESAIVPMLGKRAIEWSGGAADVIAPSKIINWIAARDDYVFATAPRRNAKLQLIVESDVEKFIGEFRNFVSQLRRDAKFAYKRHESNFASEPRFTKWTVSISGTIIMDIFNNTQYELIPYVMQSQPGGPQIRVGHRAVQCMFLLMEVWFLRILAALGFLNLAAMRRIIDDIMQAFRGVNNREWPPLHESLWAGTYFSFDIYTRKKKSRSGVAPFLPEAYRHSHGDYRHLTLRDRGAQKS